MSSDKLAQALRAERDLRVLGQQPDVHWESLRDIRRAVYAATDEALAAHEAEKQAGPDDTQRCIEARNRLNAALHGEGAVIDSLEHAVASVCAKLAEKQAGPVAAKPSRWANEALYSQRQRKWCENYERVTGFDPLMCDYEAGNETFVTAAKSSLKWYEDHTGDAYLRASDKPIPGCEFDDGSTYE